MRRGYHRRGHGRPTPKLHPARSRPPRWRCSRSSSWSSSSPRSAATTETPARPSGPRPPASGAATPEAIALAIATGAGNPRFHVVKPGDNLAAIAQETGVPLEELRVAEPGARSPGARLGSAREAPRIRWLSPQSAVGASAVGRPDVAGVRPGACGGRRRSDRSAGQGRRAAGCLRAAPRSWSTRATDMCCTAAIPHEERPIASATKLMTALVALDELPLGREVRAVPYDPAPAESRIDLRTGERMSVADLLRALLLESANDAAETLAVRAAGSVDRFVRRMNERAQEIGLRHTQLREPGRAGLARRAFHRARPLPARAPGAAQRFPRRHGRHAACPAPERSPAADPGQPQPPRA